MASTVLWAYLFPALTAVSTIPLISASLDHPLVHLDHCCLPISLPLSIKHPPIYLFRPSLYSALRWLTACCGTETAPDWRCLSPQGGPDPTSGQGSGPQGGAAPAWPHTRHTSSSRKKEREGITNSVQVFVCTVISSSRITTVCIIYMKKRIYLFLL